MTLSLIIKQLYKFYDINIFIVLTVLNRMINDIN